MNDIEMLFEEEPLQKKTSRALASMGAKPRMIKAKPNPLEGVSSWAILRELLIRHYVDFQVVGFWLGLAIVAWIKLGR